MNGDNPMLSPRLTFFCELEAEPLQALLTEQILARLSALNAAVSLGLLDLSPQRAACVRRLNQAGIPVIAWLLLPKEQGYWFNVANAPQALAFYDRFKAWTESEGLKWAGVGLDIEPDIREFSALARNWPRQIPRWLGRLFWNRRVQRARQLYCQLVARIHADGYLAEAYQFPFIADERHAHTTLLQRLTGLVDLRVDREPLAHLVPGNPFQPTKESRPWIPISSAGAGKAEPIADLAKQVSSHQRAAEDLLAAVKDNRQPLCNAQEGRVIVEMISAVFESHRLGGRIVKFPLQTRQNPLTLL